MLDPSFGEWIAPARTALLIIDMQVDFGDPHGAAGAAGHDLSAIPSALANARRLADAARSADVPVIFIRLETSPESDSPVWAEWARRRGQSPQQALALCRAGTPGAELMLAASAVNDRVIIKHRYSAFFRTPLEAMLRDENRDTLVVCGLTTECCVESTVRDAFHHDFHVFLAGDGCASYDSTLHEAALRSLDQNFAVIVRTEDIVGVWT